MQINERLTHGSRRLSDMLADLHSPSLTSYQEVHTGAATVGSCVRGRVAGSVSAPARWRLGLGGVSNVEPQLGELPVDHRVCAPTSGRRVQVLKFSGIFSGRCRTAPG